MPEHGLGQKRDITDPAHVPFVDGKPFRPPEVAVNKRRVELHRQAIINFITDHELGD